MRFGPVPVRQAEGAILAHSIRTGSLRVRKGKTLDRDDVAKLLAAGVSEVVVARLENGDVDENEAASQLAAGLSIAPSDPSISMSTAFTGRVNVTAKQAGVVQVDAAKITAFNQVCPEITLATVPDFHMADEGAMLATVKVIAFGVKQADVRRAAACVKDAITLAPPTLSSAVLIVSTLANDSPEKGIEATRARLGRWNVDLRQVDVVAHTQSALSDALANANADLILILTASATSDIYDVAPAAVKSAGGQIERFGMPVDPGNLLFIGSLDQRPVIGLPGCARSPALNGADWVLSRIVCGISVQDRDISAMGVGGLLKEIPTRPHPRRKSV